MKIKDKSNLYQWDINQTFTCIGAKYVDFPINKDVFRVEVVNDECRIPDEFFQTYGVKSVYVCYANGTYRREEFKVNSRPVPPNYIFTPTQQETFDSLVDKVNATVEDLETRAARGDFNGRDGFSPTVDVEPIEKGHRVTITDKTHSESFNVMDGKDGQGSEDSTKVELWNRTSTGAVDIIANNSDGTTFSASVASMNALNTKADDRAVVKTVNGETPRNGNVDVAVPIVTMKDATAGGVELSVNFNKQTLAKQSDLANKVSTVNGIAPDANGNVNVQSGTSYEAGDNIQINGNVISATDTVYDDTEIRGEVSSVMANLSELDTKVDSKISLLDIPIADGNTTGLVRLGGYGTSQAEANGRFYPVTINEATYKAQTNAYFIGKGTLENAKYDVVKRALTDGVGAEWTYVEKANARARMGVGRYELLKDYNVNADVNDVTFSTDDSNIPLKIVKGRIVYETQPFTSSQNIIVVCKVKKRNGSFAQINLPTISPIQTVKRWGVYDFDVTQGIFINSAFIKLYEVGNTSSTNIFANTDFDIEYITEIAFVKYSSSQRGLVQGENIKIYGIRA